MNSYVKKRGVEYAIEWNPMCHALVLDFSYGYPIKRGYHCEIPEQEFNLCDSYIQKLRFDEILHTLDNELIGNERRNETMENKGVLVGSIEGGYTYHTINDLMIQSIASWDIKDRIKLHTLLSANLNRYSRNLAFEAYQRDIKDVIFNCPATIVLWTDGSKTVVKCDEDELYDPEKGLAMAIAKKYLGNKGNYYNEFKKWLPEEEDVDEDL